MNCGDFGQGWKRQTNVGFGKRGMTATDMEFSMLRGNHAELIDSLG
jgi:hypothetical protein